MSDFDCIVQEEAEELARLRYGCQLEFLRDSIQDELSAEAAQTVCENVGGESGY